MAKSSSAFPRSTRCCIASRAGVSWSGGGSKRLASAAAASLDTLTAAGRQGLAAQRRGWRKMFDALDKVAQFRDA